MNEPVTMAVFQTLDIRTALVTEAFAHPNADRLVVLKVDIGGGESRQIVAGIRKFYEPEKLTGKTITVITNLEPAVLRGVESQGMLLAASTPEKDRVVLLQPETEMPPGCPVS